MQRINHNGDTRMLHNQSGWRGRLQAVARLQAVSCACRCRVFHQPPCLGRCRLRARLRGCFSPGLLAKQCFLFASRSLAAAGLNKGSRCRRSTPQVVSAETQAALHHPRWWSCQAATVCHSRLALNARRGLAESCVSTLQPDAVIAGAGGAAHTTQRQRGCPYSPLPA